MKKFLLCCGAATFLFSCNNNEASKTTATADSTSTAAAATSSVDLPYTASYSSSFTNGVSDADLKTVLMSYKDWADGNMTNLAKETGDSMEWIKATGEDLKLPNAAIMKMWGTYRDSLSSVSIDMEAWNKMYSTDKKDSIVATWYKEIDTYKNGKADSAYYNDINVVKGGKIIYLSQYRKPEK